MTHYQHYIILFIVKESYYYTRFGVEINTKPPISKKWYGHKWAWGTIQRYTKIQIKVNEERFYCCHTYHSHSRVTLTTSTNHTLKASVKRPPACRLTTLTTSLYSCRFYSIRWCFKLNCQVNTCTILQWWEQNSEINNI